MCMYCVVSMKLKPAKKPDCCANCKSLAWGDCEGWDRCSTHSIDISWWAKSEQICDDHRRSLIADPREAWKDKIGK